MKFYIGFLIYIGLKSVPNAELYWSNYVIFEITIYKTEYLETGIMI